MYVELTQIKNSVSVSDNIKNVVQLEQIKNNMDVKMVHVSTVTLGLTLFQTQQGVKMDG